MTPELYVGIGIFFLGGLGTVLWWLLRQKDATQQAQITELFALHKEDTEKLQQLHLFVTAEHYRKHELDTRFEKIDLTLKEGFKSLGDKFDTMNEGLIRHFGEHHSRQLSGDERKQ